METSYGRITGSYRVLDALYTLGFFYPRREEFFRSELGHLFALRGDEKLDLSTLKGSYAGAMGWGQFMPSSYRNYARDGDGDGTRDLFGSHRRCLRLDRQLFHRPRLAQGRHAALRAGSRRRRRRTLRARTISRPSYTLADLAARGYRPASRRRAGTCRRRC